ncbi:hypothetical protein [Luteimonas sp. 100069]|uniref:hypothetical protein n=1 Tax=Luteimonas sp. 100069 TaxID=2006109 RepID=UPI0018F75A31|nr:hypothetical protein [Luteimonas sp. 100069]
MPMRDCESLPAGATAMALAIAFAAASCASPHVAHPEVSRDVAIEGTVVAIDTRPWAYDGHAVVEVDVDGGGRVALQLPARWNLCEAAPVDLEALAPGVRVQAVGAAESEGRLTVCNDAGHRLVTLAPLGGPTRGGDGSESMLSPLSLQEIEGAALAGELGCSFAGTAGKAPLLLAMGDVASNAPARGVVKVGDYLEQVAAPGGFDGMLRGARFAGAGKTIDIEVTGAAVGGGESPPVAATLTYHRADGAQRQWVGWWQCGP